jgi:cytoplasmic iron level regulating protein YaaA (DUF328/UPF0246 family)
MIILLHSSKTMKSPAHKSALRQPELLHKARELGDYIKTLSPTELAACMHVSPALAQKVHAVASAWSDTAAGASHAIDSFVGDIYSGLRASDFTPDERVYADDVLRILSGLYGVLRPLDAIHPYRLEMGYKLPAYKNLYDFWGESIAKTLPKTGPIINVSSAEYTKAVLPYVAAERVIAPQFFTIDPKTGEPTFVVVHAKIARGAYARWLIKTGIQDVARLHEFKDIGYEYSPKLSTPQAPAFVAHEFGGKGLSMRLA